MTRELFFWVHTPWNNPNDIQAWRKEATALPGGN